MEPKMYVLDTNVLMMDRAAHRQFGQNRVVVPIEVLWELDGLKNCSGSPADKARGKSARAAIRGLEALRRRGSLVDGIPVNDGGLFSVVVVDDETVRSVCTQLRNHISNQWDIGIIATAFGLSETHDVLLVSNDIGVRVAANILGIDAIEYEPPTPFSLYEGYRELKLSAKRAADLAQGKAIAVPASLYPRLHPHEAVCVNARAGREILGITSADGARIVPLSQTAVSGVCGLAPKDARQQCALELLLNPAIPLVTLTGQAGTGKTLLALLAGAHQVLSGGYEQVLFGRPAVSTGEDIGFLPGSLSKKMAPWLDAMGDNLAVIQQAIAGDDWSGARRNNRGRAVHQDSISEIFGNLSLQHSRGRSIANVFIVIDEVQNLDPHVVKTLLTRPAEGTKIVLLGDLEQIDAPWLTKTTNGLSIAVESFRAESLAAHMTLTKGQRSPLATLAAKIM